MPSKSKAQQHFFGAELARKRAGGTTDTAMTEQQLEEFAATKTKGLPAHADNKHGRGAHADDHSHHGRHKRGRGDSLHK